MENEALKEFDIRVAPENGLSRRSVLKTAALTPFRSTFAKAALNVIADAPEVPTQIIPRLLTKAARDYFSMIFRFDAPKQDVPFEEFQRTLAEKFVSSDIGFALSLGLSRDDDLMDDLMIDDDFLINDEEEYSSDDIQIQMQRLLCEELRFSSQTKTAEDQALLLQRAVAVLNNRDNTAFTLEEWIQRMTQSPRVFEYVNSNLGFCILREILDTGEEAIRPLILKEIQRQSITSSSVHSLEWDGDLIYEIGMQCVSSALCKGLDDRSDLIAERWTSHQMLADLIEKLKQPDSLEHTYFMDTVKEKIRTYPAIFGDLRKFLLDEESRDLKSEEDKAEHRLEKEAEDSSSTIQDISASLQQPLERLMGQLTTLADPVLRAEWEAQKKANG